MKSSIPNKKKDLLLITNEFPYGKGEQFIQNELTILVRYFKTVYILPSRTFWTPKLHLSFFKESREINFDNCFTIAPKKSCRTNYYLLLFFISLLNFSIRNRKLKSNLTRIDALKLFKESLKASILSSKLKILIKEGLSFDIAYSYWKNEAVVSLIELRNTKIFNCPVICRAHGGDLYYNLPGQNFRPFDHYINKYIDLVFPISKAGEIHLIENGFNQEKLKVSRLGISQTKELSKISDDGIWRIVSCSSIIPVKRVHLIASALSNLSHNFIWTHFGDGICIDMVTEIVRRFPKNGQANLLGFISNNDILNFYLNNPVDLFINVSESEGIPVSIMEAMSFGIPCIATNVGGVNEIVSEDVGYLLNPFCNVSTILEAIINELSNPRIHIKRRNAKECSKSVYDSSKNYVHFTQIILAL